MVLVVLVDMDLAVPAAVEALAVAVGLAGPAVAEAPVVSGAAMVVLVEAPVGRASAADLFRRPEGPGWAVSIVPDGTMVVAAAAAACCR